jgi:hypothetical protein
MGSYKYGNEPSVSIKGGQFPRSSQATYGSTSSNPQNVFGVGVDTGAESCQKWGMEYSILQWCECQMRHPTNYWGCDCVKIPAQETVIPPTPQSTGLVAKLLRHGGRMTRQQRPPATGHYQRPDCKNNRANARQMQDRWRHGYTNSR